jgi:hypothetical protein
MSDILAISALLEHEYRFQISFLDAKIFRKTVNQIVYRKVYFEKVPSHVWNCTYQIYKIFRNLPLIFQITVKYCHSSFVFFILVPIFLVFVTFLLLMVFVIGP